MSEPMTEERLAAIADRAAHAYEYDPSEQAEVLAGTDIPALLAEVERLRAELAQVREAAAAARYYLGAFVHDSEDPGTGALGALHMLGAAGIPAERGDLSEQVMARHVAVAVEEALAARPTRAEAIREAAEAGEEVANRMHSMGYDGRASGAYDVVDELRRAADDAEAGESK
ncbi:MULTISPECIES: hypothetical protein [unclassified Streptomyces]|uniref:hypothetical protein n=1 Tax=unclassified Streptomyces TaxID=2593676 RepID=UPI00081AF103|nr:hypothetical protein [Streptomyces sp. BvitLS-983]MYX88422.1 hypothetical protein [Streptomyces sp. SID4915]SCE16607.1 hypothetical protein GA0115250_144751 [Streptomyces sp. BvitLS-983]